MLFTLLPILADLTRVGCEPSGGIGRGLDRVKTFALVLPGNVLKKRSLSRLFESRFRFGTGVCGSGLSWIR